MELGGVEGKRGKNKRHMQAMANEYLLIETHMIEHMIIHNGDEGIES